MRSSSGVLDLGSAWNRGQMREMPAAALSPKAAVLASRCSGQPGAQMAWQKRWKPSDMPAAACEMPKPPVALGAVPRFALCRA